jgi:SAM-dependent methyltransferase
MKNKPSQFHSNRQAHNWLLYDLGDKYREKYSCHYKGVMYDLGCGEAPYKEYFLQYCDSYVGVDWTNTLHNSRADIVTDLNSSFSIENAVADTLISLSVMEHLCEPQTFLNESYRILKDDGIFILGVPWMWWIHEAPHDYFRYTPYGLKYMFDKAGFKDVKIEATGGFFSMLFVKINYFSFRLLKGSKLKRGLLRPLFIPFWYLSQKLAPYLDKLDKNWDLEAQSYYVIAKKRKEI